MPHPVPAGIGTAAEQGGLVTMAERIGQERLAMQFYALMALQDLNAAALGHAANRAGLGKALTFEAGQHLGFEFRSA